MRTEYLSDAVVGRAVEIGGRFTLQHYQCDIFKCEIAITTNIVVAGKYEKPPGSYKHFYFNCTYNTLAIWLVVLIGFILLYESVRSLVPLICYNRRLLRYEMLALFASSLYSHYYGWWGTINYINDDFYEQWGHQVCIFYLFKM